MNLHKVQYKLNIFRVQHRGIKILMKIRKVTKKKYIEDIKKYDKQRRTFLRLIEQSQKWNIN